MATKNRKNWVGSIWKGKSGFYYLTLMVRGKRKTTPLKTKVKAEAERLAREMAPSEALAAKGKTELVEHVARARGALARNQMPLTEVWPKFEGSSTRSDCSPATLRRYRICWDSFSRWAAERHPDTVGDTGRISPEIMEGYFNHLWTRGISPRTYNAHRQALRLVCRIIGKDAGMDANPVDGIAAKNLTSATRREFTEEQATAILSGFGSYGIMHEDEMRVLFHVCAFSGLRLGDAARLRWSSVDLDKGLLALVPAKTKRTGRGVRIPLHPSLRAALEDARRWDDGSGDVMPRVADRYRRNPDGVGKDAVKVIRSVTGDGSGAAAGRRKLAVCEYGMHSWRHSFVSFCASAGVPMAVVQSIVGHGSPAMTQHYYHLDTETARKAVAALPEMGSSPAAVHDIAPPSAESSAVAAIQSRLAMMSEDNWRAIRDEILAMEPL